MSVMAGKIILLVFFINQVFGSKYLYPVHEVQDVVYNIHKAEGLLLIINRSIEFLITQNKIQSLIVLMELVIARNNIQHLLSYMSQEIKSHVIHEEIAQTSQRLSTCYYELFFTYTNEGLDETEKVDRKKKKRFYLSAMKMFVPYEDLFLPSIQHLVFGHIKEPQGIPKFDVMFNPVMYDKNRFIVDQCLHWLLNIGPLIHYDNKQCTVDLRCYDHKVKEKYGVYLDQALLYLVLDKYFNCTPVDLEKDFHKLCKDAYEEVLQEENFDFKTAMTNVFTLHMSICGTLGYGEFMKPRWVNRLLSWYDAKDGYFKNPGADSDPVTLTAEAIATIAVYIRALLGK